MAAHEARRYRSDIEFVSPEEHADGIVRTAGYHRKDFDMSVIWFPARKHKAMRPSTAENTFSRPSDTEPGPLDRLPPELLRYVLSDLDVRSLFNLRQVNLRSRQTVDSLMEYQMVVSHGLNLLCALLRTRLATGFSLFDIYDALCTEACALCGEFGGFVSLLAWKRCCFTCLQEAPETQVRSLVIAQKELRLMKPDLARLRLIRNLPGKYSMEETFFKPRSRLVSLHEALLIYWQREDSSTLAQPIRSERSPKLNFLASCALPFYDRQASRSEHGISCAGCLLAVEKGTSDSDGEERAFKARDMVYSRDGFLDHFRWCEQAQLLWKSSDQGSKEPAELPEAARRGGYFNDRE